MATAIDTGGANTQDAYRFVRPREGRRIWGIKGYAGKRPVWPKKPSRSNKGRINLYAIGVDSAKEVVTARLTKTGPCVSGPGACHFPMDRDQEYFEQMTAERKVVKFVKGFKHIEWTKPEKDRNEAFDCRVYAYAALQGLILGGIHLNRRAAAIERNLAEKGIEMTKKEEAPEAPTTEAETSPSNVPEIQPTQNRGMTKPATDAIKPKKRKRGRVIASPFVG